MNTEKLANWSEIVSSLAILATLIFLVVETRQNTQAIEAASSQTALGAETEYLANALQNPEAILSWTKSDPSDEEAVKHYFSLMLFVRSREAIWAQYKSGAMTQDTWERYRRPIQLVFQWPGNRAWWHSEGRLILDPEFIAEVDSLIEETPIAQGELGTAIRQVFEEP